MEEYEVRESISEPILKKYLYGSRIYRTATKDSDFDYIVVVDADSDYEYSVDNDEGNFKVLSEPAFIRRIEEHYISALECIFQSENDPYLVFFKRNKETLRRSISSTASVSFGKCGKKLKDGEIYIAKKSLFHSLRILEFGIQIAKYNKIVNYSRANGYYKEIMDMDSTDWQDYKDKFKPLYNSLKSYLKFLAPLE
ncbi:hypothetical protein Q7A53_05100 [Halobacillus rhizosphaerae]|uniref:hypothetical protein n=1 Tax=Halobacillus rhizosphaerae TaxID=3064889 RepID=UPI00398A96A5